MTRGIEWTVVLILVALAVGCADTGTCPNVTEPDQGPSEESQLITICLTGNLRAPQYIAKHVEKELQIIRRDFAVQCSVATRITFCPPWLPSSIILLVDNETSQAIQEGSYTAWDTLNAEYGVTSIGVRSIDSGMCVLYFSGILHPRQLAHIYAELPGVESVETNEAMGDSPNVYPGTVEILRTYLFRDAWGDCACGCIHSRYWYFATNHGTVAFIGAWNPEADPEEPWWWNEAHRNIEQYHSW